MKGRTRSAWWAGALTLGALAAVFAASDAIAASTVLGTPLPGGSVTTFTITSFAGLTQTGATGACPAGPAIVPGASPAPFLSIQAQPETVTAAPNEPPSPSGAVGPSHVLSISNSTYRIINRTGTIVNEVTISTFWAGLGVGTGAAAPVDSRAHYDAPTDTWYIVAVANKGTSNSRLLIAECAPTTYGVASNPTASWQIHSVAASIQAIPADPAAGMAEASAPQIGISSRWLVVTAPMSAVSGGASAGQRLWVIPKSAPTSTGPGNDAVASGFFFPVTYALDPAGYTNPGILSPSKCMDFAPVTEFVRQNIPAAPLFGPEADVYFVDTSLAGNGTQHRVTKLLGNSAGTVPTWQTLGFGAGGMGLVAAPMSFNVTGPATTAQPPAPQPGGLTTLEVGNAVIESVVLRRGKLWFTHVGGLPYLGTTNRVASFWNEFDVNTSLMVQGGAVDGGAGVWSWRPSLAVNSTNDMCISFTQSSSSMNPSACYDVRQRFTAAGTTLGKVVLWPSVNTHNRLYGARNRWGDYSATVVDAADDASFWTFQEYADVPNVGGVDQWGIACAGLTPASVIRVGPGLPITTIQGGINAAVNGDIVLVQPGTYVENIAYGGKDIEVRTPRIYLNWPGNGTTTVIRPATGASIVTFSGTEPASALLAGFTIQNAAALRGGGVQGGPAAPAAGTLARIVANWFMNNAASQTGGGIDNCDGQIHSNQFNTCVAAGGGGCSGCDGEFRGNYLTQCNGTTLGGGLNGGSGAHSDDFYFANIAPTGGGAIGAGGSFTNCTFKSNSAYGGSGGGLAACTGTVTACRMAGNVASVSGGAFSGQFGAVTNCFGGNSVSGTIIFNNQAPTGGAFANSTCAISVNDFSTNKATNGSGGAISGHTTGLVTLNNFVSNTATQRGGAINGTSATVSLSIFTTNSAQVAGGAIDGCAGTVSGCGFVGNTAPNGGAMSNSTAAAVVTGQSSFAGNAATSAGGAFFQCAGVVQGGCFIGNVNNRNTAVNGGAFANCAAAVNGNTVTGNTATGGAGGAFFACTGAVTNNVIQSNIAANGGAFSAHSTGLVSFNNPISLNQATTSGGAFHNCSSVISNNTVTNNQAVNGSGGAFSGCSGAITLNIVNGNNRAPSGGAFATCNGAAISANGITGNQALTGDGGAFFNCNAQITGNAIDSNTAPNGRGGAIFGGSGQVDHNTISGNSCGLAGGGINTHTGTVTQNNIFLNSAGTDGGGMSIVTGLISNNTIHENHANSGVGGGIHNSDTDIFNNTIMHNTCSAANSGGGMHGCNGTGNLIRNNILWFNLAAGAGGAGRQIKNSNAASFCCIEGGGGGGSNNSNGMPSLVLAGLATPAALRDFHEVIPPTGTSSTIDQGQNNRTFVDFDGQARPNPNTNKSDIGADEF